MFKIIMILLSITLPINALAANPSELLNNYIKSIRSANNQKLIELKKFNSLCSAHEKHGSKLDYNERYNKCIDSKLEYERAGLLYLAETFKVVETKKMDSLDSKPNNLSNNNRLWSGYIELTFNINNAPLTLKNERIKRAIYHLTFEKNTGFIAGLIGLTEYKILDYWSVQDFNNANPLENIKPFGEFKWDDTPDDVLRKMLQIKDVKKITVDGYIDSDSWYIDSIDNNYSIFERQNNGDKFVLNNKYSNLKDYNGVKKYLDEKKTIECYNHTTLNIESKSANYKVCAQSLIFSASNLNIMGISAEIRVDVKPSCKKIEKAFMSGNITDLKIVDNFIETEKYLNNINILIDSSSEQNNEIKKHLQKKYEKYEEINSNHGSETTKSDRSGNKIVFGNNYNSGYDINYYSNEKDNCQFIINNVNSELSKRVILNNQDMQNSL